MTERPVRQADRLSSFEALLWTLEQDPRFASGFANITFLDRPADPERMRTRMARAAASVPPLRQRILADPLGLAAPRWIDDPDFTIERHVGTMTLPSPGDDTRLVAAALEFCNRPYDTDHPLWGFLLVDGLSDGRGAMIQRFHHTIADGIGMMRMSEFFIDLERDPPELLPPTPPPGAAAQTPGTVRVLGGALGHSLTRVAATARKGTALGRDVICDPRRLGAGARRATDTAIAVTREVASMGRRRSPAWTDRGPGRALFLLRVPFDPIRGLASRHDVTVNDVFVAGVTGGAGAYHRAVGEPVDELRMAMPVSTRADREAGGNAFGMARTLVPTHEDPLTRLASIHAALGTVRGNAGVSLMQQLAGIANLLPAPVLTWFTGSQVASVDFTTSNVRGAPFAVFMGGARVESNHPIGPLTGTAFNLTMLTYNGSLDMGLHVDTDAVTRPDLLARAIEDSFAELLDT